jgi:hypothetical protein
MAHANNEKCITLEELKKWYAESKREEFNVAREKTKKCPVCRRAWLKFWVELKQ